MMMVLLLKLLLVVVIGTIDALVVLFAMEVMVGVLTAVENVSH